ncbi:MAG: 3-deoxy-D-manno-octulosonic acid transferase [Gammaproteobacteria bacterium]|nr:3-deoxy-D-manno-octulosonic acid transferase [Gammaproteobacteria bacterium]
MKATVTRLLYTTLLYLIIPIELIRLYIRGRIVPEYHLRWSERFAVSLPDINSGGFWVHTASVGEFLAALPVIRQLLESHPESPITVTTMTPTGSERVKVKLGEQVNHIYAPYDLPDVISRFLDHVKPDKLLIMETELWPNIIAAASKRGIDIILMNARLSEQSAYGYSRFKSLTSSMLSKISVIAAHHQDDAERFIKLGAIKSSLTVTGNIKYDLKVKKNLLLQGKELREKFPSELVWIAGSTHRGEDEQILSAHRFVRKLYPDAQLILVPRHPERFDEVANLCQARGFSFSRRSLNQETDQQIYLGDTMGELLLLFAVADMAFIGGSLVEIGGHNLLEPAALSKPVLIGPYDYNFLDITRQMLAAKAAVRVDNAEQLAQQIILWQQNPDLMKKAGEQGLSVVNNNQGALKRLMVLIEKV